MADGSWRGFVNAELTMADKKTIKKNVLVSEAAWQWLLDMAQNGYKVSISFVLDNLTWIVSLTGKGGPNDGLTLTMRHADPFVAITAVQHMHDTIYEGDWSKGGVQSSFNW